MQGEGIERTTIALFMLVAVLGGLAFQVPVGWLSDRFDRRIVLAALGLASPAPRLPKCCSRSLPMVLTTAALLGGFMSTLYPVCVARRARPHASRSSGGGQRQAHPGERARLGDRPISAQAS